MMCQLSDFDAPLTSDRPASSHGKFKTKKPFTQSRIKLQDRIMNEISLSDVTFLSAHSLAQYPMASTPLKKSRRLMMLDSRREKLT